MSSFPLCLSPLTQVALLVAVALHAACGSPAIAKGPPGAEDEPRGPDARAAAGGSTSTPTPDEDAPASSRVIVFLPLTGRARTAGNELAQHLEAFRRVHASTSIEVMDVGPDEGSGERLRALMRRGDVVGCVAFADRLSADRLAPIAADTGKPCVFLALGEGVVGFPGKIWRGLHTAPLVSRTVSGLARAQGALRMAIVRPEVPYGEAHAVLMRAAFEAAGGVVVVERVYSAKKPDWSAALNELTKTEFDCLFIPDRATVAASALAHLASMGLWSRGAATSFSDRRSVREIVVLGTPEWYEPSVLRASARYFEGSLFPLAFAEESVTGAKLASHLRDANLGRPTALDALLWDAILALHHHLERRPETSTAPADAVSSSALYSVGVSLLPGSTEAVRSLFAVKVHDGQVSPLP